MQTHIGTTRRRLWRLAAARAFWPLAVLVTFFLALALSGFLDRIGKGASAIVSLVFFAGLVVLFLKGRQRFAAPSQAEAENALDRGSELRPIQSLTDRPAGATLEEQTLWQSHRERLLRELRRLVPPLFRPEWKALDRFYLRYVFPAGILVLAVIAGTSVPGRLERAFSPDIGALMGADRMIVEAWVTPPEHTGRAPIFLKPGLQGVSVPEGSEITLRTKAPSAPKLVLKGKKTKRQKFTATPDGAWEAKAKIVADTRVIVRWWGERASWKLKVTPDEAPEVRFVSLPVIGARDMTDFTWSAKDDYGLIALELAISLQTPDPAAPKSEDRVPVSLPGTVTPEASEKTSIDLTRHRWAGLPVRLRLVGIDGAGQEGFSEYANFTLPEKLFIDPLARAAQDVRVTVLREPRDYKKLPRNPASLFQGRINVDASSRLDLAPPGVQKGALMLDAITWQGEKYFDNVAAFLAFRSAHGMLQSASSKTQADEVDPLLWALALKLEFGSTADALRRLEAAKNALEQALRTGASEEEIMRRMQAFRDAANEYLAAKMAEAMAKGLPDAPSAEDQQAGGGMNMEGQDFEDMLNALEQSAETGASEEARQMLAGLMNMLENLDFQKGQSGEGGTPMPGDPGEPSEEASEEEKELTDAQRRLAEILREQRELNDDTLAEERGEQKGGQQGNQPQPGEGQSQLQRGAGEEPGQNEEAGEGKGAGEERSGEQGSGGRDFAEDEKRGEGSGSREAEGTLAERQAKLGELVEKLGREKGIGKGAGKEDALEGKLDGGKLGDVRQAQKRAEELLGMGQEGRAGRSQEQATEMLSEISRDVAESLDEMREARRNKDGRGASETDPFGRMMGSGNDSDSVEIPAEAERQRAKDILDELRRRYNDAKTDEERDYLRRLMDRF